MAKKCSLIILGLTPLFFLPATQNFYDTNKWMLMTFGALLTLVFWAVTLLRTQKPLEIHIPSEALGFAALSLAALVGLCAGSTNKIEALLSPLGPITFVAFTILILAGSSATQRDKTYFRWFLYAGTGLIGLIALYQALGIGKLMFPQVSFLADPLWTPTGSVTTTLALFFITISLLVPDTIAAFKKRQESGMVALLAISCVIIAVGAGITIFQFIPKITGMLPFDVGMVVAAQVFKNIRLAAAGVGAENFVTAFTVVRPASFNLGPLAGAAFGTNADFFLHILTVYGLTGLAASLVLAGTLVSGNKKDRSGIAPSVCLAGLLLIPPTVPLLALTAAVLILTHDEKKLPPPKPIMTAPWIRTSAGALLLATAAVSFYFVIRAYAADVFFFQSLLSTQAHDGTKTYNRQMQAIRANTFISRYHSTYSQTSLALANSIANAIKNDQDRQLAGQLVQQAVKEAKTAVNLNPRNVAAWENLGLTYQTIMPVATDAATWALAVYTSAVKLDPSNPILFVNIGSVLVNQQKYDTAITAFERALQLKPSDANASYNLANVYILKGDTVTAAKILTDTIKLVRPESVDYYKIKNELDALRQKSTAGVP